MIQKSQKPLTQLKGGIEMVKIVRQDKITLTDNQIKERIEELRQAKHTKKSLQEMLSLKAELIYRSQKPISYEESCKTDTSWIFKG